MSRMLIFLGPLTSLAISPIVSYDPINPIKNLVVSSFAFCLLSLMIRLRGEVKVRVGKTALFFSSLFVFSLLAVMFLSKTALTEQFWGVFGRNNGFLNYFSLAVVFVAVIMIQSKEAYRLILRSLLLAAIPMTIYCIIQILGYDPFSWSAFATFGTLGNVNFLSAFMGLATVATLYFAQEAKSKILKVALVILALTDIAIIWQTDSIQGLMMVLAGSSLLILFWLIKRSKLITVFYLLSLATLTFFIFQSFLNKGPLAKLIYQPSITYRGDYMAAGWNMFLNHPIAGVGLDSYGDWYRAERGIVSTFRTGYGRTSNASHNVYIDMAANGGLLLFGTFVMINVLILSNALRALKLVKLEDKFLVYLLTIWIVFQIQAMVSIAQIGISIWGWLFSGALFGYSRLLLREDLETDSKRVSKTKPRKVTLDAASSVLAFMGFALGFLLAFLQFKVDADYRSSTQRQDLAGMVEVTKNPLASSFLFFNTQYIALTSNNTDIAYEINLRLRSKFPRELAGWFALWNIPNATPEERTLAKQKIMELDPFFFCLEPNYASLMKVKLLELPPSKQRELAFAWGADPKIFLGDSFNISALGEDYLLRRFAEFCS